MQTLGLIETKGLIPAIISADAMLKAANISLLDKTYIGGGLVTISIIGDVGAVRAAVDAGSAAVRDINVEYLISEHVIPHPYIDIKDMLLSAPMVEDEEKQDVAEEEEQVNEEKDEIPVESVEDELIEADEPTEEVEKIEKVEFSNPKTKVDLENIVSQFGIKEGISALKKLKVVELRSLARKHDAFGIKGKEISKAGKNVLIKEFEKHYQSNE